MHLTEWRFFQPHSVGEAFLDWFGGLLIGWFWFSPILIAVESVTVSIVFGAIVSKRSISSPVRIFLTVLAILSFVYGAGMLFAMFKSGEFARSRFG